MCYSSVTPTAATSVKSLSQVHSCGLCVHPLHCVFQFCNTVGFPRRSAQILYISCLNSWYTFLGLITNIPAFLVWCHKYWITVRTDSDMEIRHLVFPRKHVSQILQETSQNRRACWLQSVSQRTATAVRRQEQFSNPHARQQCTVKVYGLQAVLEQGERFVIKVKHEWM